MASPPVSAGWTRRSVLLAASLGAASGLTACRVRLEDDAPHIPLVPRRTPMADEAALTQVLVATWRLEDLARAVPGAGMPSRLASLHTTQATALSRTLVAGGAPVPQRTAVTSTASPVAPTSATSASTSAPPSATATTTATRALRDGEAGGLTALLADLASVTPGHAPLLVSLAAQRAASGTLLGTAPTWQAVRAPTREQAVPMLVATRAAVYGFEVVAAHADAKHRPLADAALSSLRARTLELQQLAGASAGPPPLGYPLPYPVNDPTSANRLARQLLLALERSTAAAATTQTTTTETTTTGGSGSAALTTIAHWLTDTELLAARWGTATSAFPGLVMP